MAGGHVALPASPHTLARYFTVAARERDGAGYRYKSSTFGVWLAAIGARHAGAGLLHPGKDVLVVETLRGIRNLRAAEGETVRAAAPLRTDDLQTVVTSIAGQARGWVAQVAARRDIALLVVGFSGALRRSELAALEVRDIARADDREGEWLAVRLRGTGTGDADEFVYLPKGRTSGRWCPCCAFLRWLAVIAAYDSAVEMKAVRPPERDGEAVDRDAVARAAADDGALAVTRLVRVDDGDLDEHVCARPWPRVPQADVPLFRSLRNGTPREKQALTGGSITRMLHRRAARAGLDPATVELFSAHALRAGAATEALQRGASLDQVMNLTRHRSAASVRRYDRDPRPGNHAAEQLGL
ncbi:hypothetical protein [Nocardia sp. NPDC004860]|uniref:hypothetical protein n=1 Tax=Nocardia sp. NPDC004860 TaxID=3154557 RepID=UPI0033A0ADE4